MKKTLLAMIVLYLTCIVGISTGFTKDITLNWDTQPEAVRYNVYQAELSQAANKTLYSSGWTLVKTVTETTTVVAGLDDTKTFAFYVTAINAMNIESQASNLALDRIVPGRVTGVIEQ